MRHTGTIALETERLILRRFTAEDAAPMFENWAADPDVTKYLPWKEYSRADDVRAYLKGLEEKYLSPDFYDWCIVWKENGEPIGSAGAVSVNDRLRSFSVGYCLSKKYWGRGIIPEAVNAVLKHFFETVGAARVSGAHFVDNPKSGRVLAKCGFKEEGLLRKNALDNAGNFVDVKLYALTDDDYFSSKNNKNR